MIHLALGEFPQARKCLHPIVSLAGFSLDAVVSVVLKFPEGGGLMGGK